MLVKVIIIIIIINLSIDSWIIQNLLIDKDKDLWLIIYI